jgi:hypothetical protein
MRAGAQQRSKGRQDEQDRLHGAFLQKVGDGSGAGADSSTCGAGYRLPLLLVVAGAPGAQAAGSGGSATTASHATSIETSSVDSSRQPREAPVPGSDGFLVLMVGLSVW